MMRGEKWREWTKGRREERKRRKRGKGGGEESQRGEARYMEKEVYSEVPPVCTISSIIFATETIACTKMYPWLPLS